MRKYSLLFLTLCILLSSCSYQQFSAAATGSSLGGMFGSSIGGLIGGPRGYDKGVVAGMIIGGAVGVAVADAQTKSSHKDRNTESYDDSQYSDDGYYEYEDDGVEYGTYNSPRYKTPMAVASDLEYIEVENVKFLDSNNNERLDRDEQAYIVFDIKNRGNHILYNVTPHITCNSSRVVISPAATISVLPSGRGVRYKAMVRAYRKMNKDKIKFTVSFGTGSQAVQAKSFTIRTH